MLCGLHARLCYTFLVFIMFACRWRLYLARCYARGWLQSCSWNVTVNAVRLFLYAANNVLFASTSCTYGKYCNCVATIVYITDNRHYSSTSSLSTVLLSKTQQLRASLYNVDCCRPRCNCSMPVVLFRYKSFLTVCVNTNCTTQNWLFLLWYLNSNDQQRIKKAKRYDAEVQESWILNLSFTYIFSRSDWTSAVMCKCQKSCTSHSTATHHS